MELCIFKENILLGILYFCQFQCLRESLSFCKFSCRCSLKFIFKIHTIEPPDALMLKLYIHMFLHIIFYNSDMFKSVFSILRECVNDQRDAQFL